MKKFFLALVFVCCIPMVYKASASRPNPSLADFLNSEETPPFTTKVFQNPQAFIKPDGDQFHFILREGPYQLIITLGPESSIICQHIFTPPALSLTQQTNKDDIPLERKAYHSAACEKPACTQCLFFLLWFTSKMAGKSLISLIRGIIQ